MLGIILDEDSFNRDDLDLGELKAMLPEWRVYASTSAERVSDRIQDAHVVITNKVKLGEDHLEQASNLKLICVAATGTNNIEISAAQKQGIQVCNVRAYATSSVTQHVFALILSLARHLPDYQQAVITGRWQQSTQFCLLDYPIVELNGKTLGIVGFGELGRAVAKMAEAFDMQVLIAARPGTTPGEGRVALDDLLPQIDILSLHCPLTETTQGLIGERELGLMKPSAFLINTARGGIVDEQALADALREKKIAGAGIDVLAVEPPADDHPLLKEKIPNLIVTPHIAWASRESRQRLVDEISHNIESWLNGEVRNRVV